MIFLKLGGSLITDKTKAETARMDVIYRLVSEIKIARDQNPELKLLLGHGSGSFGHPVAAKFGTHKGAANPEEWAGFTQVWYAANRLNRILLDVMHEDNLPAISLPPSASSISTNGEILQMAIEPIERALQVGLIPVVQGDVAFDRVHGAGILSTEMVFRYLAPQLKPDLVLLAGIELGVYKEYPPVGEILPVISEDHLAQLHLGPSAGPDVTGGMAEKVHEALAISRAYPHSSVRIFSGLEVDSLRAALRGADVGTRIVSQDQPAT